jgi:hypothetical protein
MISFIGDHYLYLPVAAALVFMLVVSVVSIEDAFRRN